MAERLVILAFGFGNLAMLGWLAAAAAPLLIHLWSRRRYRQVPWAAVQFLLAAMKKNARRMQLQQWLLLAVRTLIILLVVLAVAEPYGKGLLAGSASAPAHKLLVIDSSFSMGYREGDETLLARAKRLAADLVRDSGSADTFTIIQMASPPRTIIGRETIDRRAIVEAIESLSPTAGGASLSQTLELVAEAVVDDNSVGEPVDPQAVYFFTDLQRVTWQHEPSRSSSEPAKTSTADEKSAPTDRIAALADRAALVVVDIAPPRRSNLAITRLSTSEPYITVGDEIAIEATLHQFDDEPRRGCAVELIVDDVPVGEQVIDIPAGGDARVRFTHRFPSAGGHSVSLRAADDMLAIDNSRWIAPQVAAEVRVLCVAGEPGAAKYIADALDPDPTDNSPIRPVVVSGGDLAELEFAEFDSLFLCNVAQLTSNEATRLARYVEQGGGVVFFLGDQVLADQYNALSENEPALLPVRLGEVIAEATFRLDPLDYRHPIVAPFRGRERAGLLTTPVARHFRLELLPQNERSEVALALPGGDPLIVASQIGRGRSIVVATDGSLPSVDRTNDEPWTAWPTWPSFLPIVHELLNYAVSGQSIHREQLVGAFITGVLNQGAGNGDVRVERPDGRTASVRPVSTPSGWEWSYGPVDLSGIYRVNADFGVADALPAQTFAVNVDTRESDLTKAEVDELAPQFVVRQHWQAEKRDANDGVVTRAAWHGTLLAWAFALMLLESLLAWYFGRGAA